MARGGSILSAKLQAALSAATAFKQIYQGHRALYALSSKSGDAYLFLNKDDALRRLAIFPMRKGGGQNKAASVGGAVLSDQRRPEDQFSVEGGESICWNGVPNSI
ncbi:hypothetical protein DSM21852_38710 [Methylocystis bryophila]|uniref:Uncharacterized protein n=1 Tax=Methylocystis bryophila TaxID=655015 RepID=A0A1W6MSJ6_9HYPH|nr:hypothetical protein B1812_05235 [Methylocystis bryophila]BDV40618.1 hypothetical protein DSM21852_38710 [Methylocystis bryophila]